MGPAYLGSADDEPSELMAPTDCCYCGQPSTSRDHVPSRKLFPTPRPSDLITVPSCDPCNNRLSPEEEYFLHVLLSHREADTSVARQLREQLFDKPRNERRIRMAQRMLSATERAALHAPSGRYLGQGRILTIDRDKFDKVVEKITRGLYFHAFGERVPSERASEVILTPERGFFQNDVVKQVIAEGFGGSVGGEVFEYRIARAPEPPGVALCVMLFFGTIPIVCTLLRPEALEEYAAKHGNAADLSVGRTSEVIRGTLAGLAVLLVTWVGLAFLVWEVVAAAAGREEAIRLVPYVNAHLLEEAMEGAYAPWRDPIFIVRLLGNTVVPFALAAWVAGRFDRRAALAVLALGVSALLWLHRQVLTPGFPSAVRAGFLIELAAAAATVAATIAATRPGRRVDGPTR